MRLILEHPQEAAITCDECKKWVYDFDKGKWETYQCGSRDNIVRQVRPGSPPCVLGRDCAKGSPEKEHEHNLLNRNARTLKLYMEYRVCGGLVRDPLTRDNFRTIDAIVRRWERGQQAIELANVLLPILARRY